MKAKIQPVFFRDVEKELVRVFPILLTEFGEQNFKVSTQKQKTTLTQYVLRSESSELISRVFKAEDCALTVYLKAENTRNAAYAEGKRVGALVEALVPILPNHSTFISYVDGLDLVVNDFDDVDQIYTIFLTFTAYHKGVVA